jgi:hypothetical protein
MIYQITIKGELDQSWSDWLGNLKIDCSPQADHSVLTTLTVDVVDQSALFGVLDRIRDLNLGLIKVNCKPKDDELEQLGLMDNFKPQNC